MLLRLAGCWRLLLILGMTSVVACPRPAVAETTKRARYKQSVRRWHQANDVPPAALDEQGRPKLVLYNINTRETLMAPAQSEEGGFSDADRERISQLLRDPRTAEANPIDPTLLDWVYRLQRHFSAPAIRVVSAYRSPSGGKISRHAQGKALDLIVPGASDRAVAAFARTLGTCGVGLYTKSGFVHLDVRETRHFWVDSSGPGQQRRARRKPKRQAHFRPPSSGSRQ